MKTTLQMIETATGIPNRTLSRYKNDKALLFKILETGTVAHELGYRTEDFIAIRKIESVFDALHRSEARSEIYREGFEIRMRKGLSREQRKNIALGMTAMIFLLDDELLQAYRKIIDHLKK